MIYVLAGEVTLVEEGRPDETLRAGDAAGWQANAKVGHTIENRSDKPARLLEIGPRMAPVDTAYSVGLDLLFTRIGRSIAITARNGRAYAPGEDPGPVDDGTPETR